MANIKLTNDNWETSGIYDIGQSKTQRVLNASFVSDISDLNGAITSLGSDDIANDSTNVSGSKVTDALDTLNGAISAITPLDTTPTNGSTKGITSDAVYEAINAINLPYLNVYVDTMVIASQTQITLASLTLTKGVWIIIGFHEWTSSFNNTYQDKIKDATGSELAIMRNISGLNGGGANLVAVKTVGIDSLQVEYTTYQFTTSDQTAMWIRLAAFRLATL